MSKKVEEVYNGVVPKIYIPYNNDGGDNHGHGHGHSYGHELIIGGGGGGGKREKEEGYRQMKDNEAIIRAESKGEANMYENKSNLLLEGQVDPYQQNNSFLVDVKAAASDVDNVHPTFPLMEKEARGERIHSVYDMTWLNLVLIETVLTLASMIVNNLGTTSKKEGYGYSLKCQHQRTIVSQDGISIAILDTNNSTQLCSSADTTGYCWDVTTSELTALYRAGMSIFYMVYISLLPLFMGIILRYFFKVYPQHVFWSNSCFGLGWTIKVIGVIIWMAKGASSCYLVGFKSSDNIDPDHVITSSLQTGITIILAISSAFPLTVLLILLTYWRRKNPTVCPSPCNCDCY